MISLIIVLSVIAVAMWLTYTYVPAPVKWIFLAILGIALLIVTFRVAGIEVG